MRRFLWRCRNWARHITLSHTPEFVRAVDAEFATLNRLGTQLEFSPLQRSQILQRVLVLQKAFEFLSSTRTRYLHFRAPTPFEYERGVLLTLTRLRKPNHKEPVPAPALPLYLHERYGYRFLVVLNQRMRAGVVVSVERVLRNAPATTIISNFIAQEFS